MNTTLNVSLAVADNEYYSHYKFTYDEAVGLAKDGYRLPTVFELIKLQKESGSKETKVCWSSSPFAPFTSDAWGVGFSYGYDDLYLKVSNLYVRLVRGGLDFDSLHDVSSEGVTDYKKDGTLPEWHPPLAQSMVRLNLPTMAFVNNVK